MNGSQLISDPFTIIITVYVTGSEKTGLINTKCTYSYYGTYLMFYIQGVYVLAINNQ